MGCIQCLVGCEKYRCPTCSQFYCSIPCYKLHSSECRVSTRFIPKEELPGHLSADMEYLEKIKARISPCQTSDGNLKSASSDEALLDLAGKRSIRLKTMPRDFTRAKLNKTRAIRGLIYWTVELVLVGEDRTEIADEVCEDVLLWDWVVERYGRWPAAVLFQGKAVGMASTLKDLLTDELVIEFPKVTIEF